jgi:membrane protease YdiL (CAAX protease family)
VTLGRVGVPGNRSVMETIRDRVRALSARTEFAIVVVGAFGYFVLRSLHSALYPAATPPISQSRLDNLLVYESITLVLLCIFLHWRGWTISRLGVRVSARDTLIGLGLVVVGYVGFGLMWWIATAIGIHPSYAGTHRELVAHGLALPVVIAVSVLNPIYEETFLCGYVVTSAKAINRTVAGVNVSIAIRLLYHLYQGGIGVLQIIPIGLIFTWWYARTGRLWPVFVAHALFDAIGLLQFVR